MRQLPGNVGIAGFLSRLARDQRGNTLAMMAAALVPLLAIIGGSVDVSRSYMVKTRLQQACDAGVLAGRKAVGDGTYTAAAQTQANRFFTANYRGGWQGSQNLSFSSSTPDNGTTVNGTASVVLPTVVMYFFGRETINLAVECSAVLEVSNADITMVLDTTGSMNEDISDGSGGTTTRIAALRSAMKNFYGILAAAQTGTTSRMRYAFVPYTGTVNVGELIRTQNSAWLDKTHSYQSRVPIHYTRATRTYDGQRTSGGGTLDNYYDNDAERAMCDSYTKQFWNSDNTIKTTVVATLERYRTSTYRDYKCKVTETIDRYYERQDHPNPTTANFAAWRYRRVDYPNLTNFINGGKISVYNGDSGAAVDYSWSGCIEERDTVASGSIAFANKAITPSGTFDLDIDGVPASSEEGWRPYFNQISYWRYNGGNLTTDNSYSGTKAQTACPKKAQLLSVMTKSQFDAYADGLTADGGTYHDIGMIWGARLSSPDGIFGANVRLSPNNGSFVARHMIFMTDGELAPSIYYHSAYGLEYWDRRVTSDGSTNQYQRHSQRFRAVCEAAKAKGIRVWVVAFATDLTPDLSSCASANSAFVSTNPETLNATFAEIANSIADLRLRQ